MLAIDGRDGGLTDHPESGYAAEDFAADLLAVHDALGARPLTLVGHSRAGWLATWFAERHQARVERLVLVDPARLQFVSETAAERFYGRVREGLGPFASEDAALERARSEDPLADWNEGRVRGFLANFHVGDDGSLAGYLPAGAVDQLRRARDREDSVGPFLDRVTCPVLLLVGTRQDQGRVEDKLRYAEGIADCTTVRLDGTHFLHTDLPEPVAGLIGDFVTGLGPNRAE